jgi:hypothetical protein
MSVTLTYLRLYADEAGVSHFAPLEIEVSPRDFAPPAPPFSVSALAPAFRYGFLHLPQWLGRRPTPFPPSHVDLRAIWSNGVRGW